MRSAFRATTSIVRAFLSGRHSGHGRPRVAAEEHGLAAGKWLFAICTSIALSISAAYELFEWQYAVMFGGKQAEDFLGSQGDIWDAQQDMFQALCGAVVSQLVLSRLQDRQLTALTSSQSN
jgi:hypothetical protein